MLKEIEKILQATPAIKAKDIAKKMQREKADVNAFLYRYPEHFQKDTNHCWTLKVSQLQIEFAKDCWIDCRLFESALAAVESPLDTKADLIVFVIPKGCNLLLEAIARLMALSNQLAYKNKKVTIDFSQRYKTLTYVNRIGFFDHLDKRINILPERPETSGAQVYKHNNDSLVELGVINPTNPDESIPQRLKSVFVSHAGDKYEQTAFTVLAELFGNVRDHSASPIPGFVGLQIYKNISRPHIQTVISDSGKGILGTLKPILEKKYPEIAQEIAQSEMDSDVLLLKKVFTQGQITQSEDDARGLGLKSSSDAASKFNATISVRQENCEVKFFYKNGKLSNLKYQIMMPCILGTHICFDFELDQNQ